MCNPYSINQAAIIGLFRVINRYVGKTPGIGGRLPTYRFMRLNKPVIAAWFVVIE